ncbi:MAG: efflux RND transporter permease subunit, partial [Candidatus Levybacteria bacterium]|nr:efflux RND transporter permease subunit [Candidatus Levybacteria bacterium]
MAGKTSYLKHLNFDQKLNNTFVAKYLRNTRLVILLVLLIVFAGIFSFLNIPKVLNPDVKIPIVIVSAVLPGAGPQDVESLVSIPIEDSISGLPKIDSITSSSQESVSLITVQFLSGVDPDKATQDVQSAVDSVTNLPKDATTPKVQKLDFQNVPVWSFIVSGQSDIASLMKFSEGLQTRLKDTRTIDHVTVSGLETQEIQVVIKPEAISTYNLNPQILNAAINTSTNSYPAGSIKTIASNYALTIDPEVVSVDDVRNLRININGQSVLLSNVATVFLKSKPSQAPSYLATDKTQSVRTVRFDVYKTNSATIDQAITDAKKITNQQISQYDGHFNTYSILDTQNEINKQFDELIHDLIITVVLVFITLLIFLGARQAVVASMAIPLTFMISFIVMNITGIALSFIAFFSLLLSLGLLVDDTVVVISAMTSYFRTGRFTPLQTGLLVWRDFITAIFTTTITTVWAFLPLLLTTGIIGEFIKPVPVVVSSTLLASFGVAMLITLPFIIILLNGFFPRRVVILVRILFALLILGIGISTLPKNKLFFVEVLAFIILLFVTFTARKLLFARFKVLLKNIFENYKPTLYRHSGKSKRSGDASRIKPQKNGSWTSPTTQRSSGPWGQDDRKQSNLNRYIDQGFISFEHIGKIYRRLLDKILSSSKNRKRVIVIVVVFSLFSYILVPLGFVRNEFFPKSDQNYLYINIELPSGTNLD